MTRIKPPVHCTEPSVLLTSMAVIFPVLGHRLKWKLPGGIHDSKLVSCGRSLLPWLRVSANEAMIRNLSLTLEDIVEPAAKAIPAQK